MFTFCRIMHLFTRKVRWIFLKNLKSDCIDHSILLTRSCSIYFMLSNLKWILKRMKVWSDLQLLQNHQKWLRWLKKLEKNDVPRVLNFKVNIWNSMYISCLKVIPFLIRLKSFQHLHAFICC